MIRFYRCVIVAICSYFYESSWFCLPVCSYLRVIVYSLCGSFSSPEPVSIELLLVE